MGYETYDGHVPVLVHEFGPKTPETKENPAHPVFSRPQGHCLLAVPGRLMPEGN